VLVLSFGLFHASNNSVIDSICYFTGILPPRYQIDQACMKYIIACPKIPLKVGAGCSVLCAPEPL